MYLASIKPIGNVIMKDMIKAAIWGDMVIKPKSTSSLFRIKL
jgi:hypothetical protein